MPSSIQLSGASSMVISQAATLRLPSSSNRVSELTLGINSGKRSRSSTTLYAIDVGRFSCRDMAISYVVLGIGYFCLSKNCIASSYHAHQLYRVLSQSANIQ